MSKLVRFARTQGAKDKKKRKSRLLRNIAMGVGGAALLGGGAYLLSKRPKRTPETDDFFDFTNDILGRKAKRRANNPPGYGRVVDDPDWMTVDISKPQKRLQAEKPPVVSSRQKRLNRTDKIRKRMGSDIFVDTRRLAKEKQAASRRLKELKSEYLDLASSPEHYKLINNKHLYYGTPRYIEHFNEVQKKLDKMKDYADNVYHPANAKLFERTFDLKSMNKRLRKKDPVNYSSGLGSTNFSHHTLSTTGMKSLDSMMAEFGRGKDLFKRKKRKKLGHYLAEGAFWGSIAGGLATIPLSRRRGLAGWAQRNRIEAAGILAGAGIGAGVYGVKKIKDGITQNRSKKRSPMSILTRK